MLATKESNLNSGGLKIESILAQVEPQMTALTQFMDSQVTSFEPELQELVRYSLKNQGKRLRPMLVFFSGWNTERPAVNDDLIKAAGVVEFVHLATLVHDDILDDATLRHNLDTVSAKYGSSVAVLLGDALFSQALNLATEFSTVEVCRAVSLATRRVCAGEVRQTFERGNANFPLEEYFRVIEMKTAELFQVSCLLGAKLNGYEDNFAQACSEFGRNLGIAYQIFDDLADFLGDEGKIGKTLGTDLASGKYTLPVLLLLQKLAKADADALIKRMSENNVELAEISKLLKDQGIFEDVFACFFRYLDAAENQFKELPNLPPVEHLLRLSSFVRQLIGRLTEKK